MLPPGRIANMSAHSVLDMLYARTESGLLVPPSALPPPVPPSVSQPTLTRQMRRHLERNGANNHCRCGRVISWGRALCQACSLRHVSELTLLNVIHLHDHSHAK
jgi:hypothetical protein